MVMTDEAKIQEKVLKLPKGSQVGIEEVSTLSSIIIVGANGSGKTRIGAWIEMTGPQKESAHRIAAQRSLVFPKQASPTGLDSAKTNFLWSSIPSNWDLATFEANRHQMKMQRKYGGDIIGAENAPVNDFTELLTLLFSENYALLQKSEEEFYKTHAPVNIKPTKIRDLKDIWESILPHRTMSFNASEVILNPTGVKDHNYNATAMSDGERVIFYLIGQVLCAQENAILIVDEPEIHLHKAIQDKLWKLLELKRPDCLFVYLTHDLDFASSRKGAKKIFMKSYDGSFFDWEIIPNDTSIPENILLQLVGSRKPIIFVEGDEGSKDLEVYKLAFPNHLIMPVGGCSDVILSTKAFRRLNRLHHLECYGIIDRDYLADGQIESYERSGIYTLNVAEIENLFIVPELIKVVAHQLLLDADKTLESVEDFIIKRFDADINEHSMNVAKHFVSLHFGRFSSEASSSEKFEADYLTHVSMLQIKNIIEDAKKEAIELIDNRKYTEILKVYNKKDLLNSINFLFDVKGPNSTYLEKLREMNRRGIINIGNELINYLPELK